MDENIKAILEKCEQANNLTIYDSFVKAYPKIDVKRRIVVSISGGSDSDIMLDIFARLDTEKKVKYIFFDTGIEYEATKRHLDFLESKYSIKIERLKAITPVPLGCRKYGVPFWSKWVSEMIDRLQKSGFKWEDKPFEELVKEYPKCQYPLKWWCNKCGNEEPEKSKFNINYIRGLKEYMIANPPPFKISANCCKGAKKDNAKKYLSEYEADLNCIGVRKAEGGIRSVAYKTCFDLAKGDETWDKYRPIFWYSDKDKEEFERIFDVCHSDCYTKYGLKRTGCACCPFGKDFYKELEILKEHEPKLYKAVNNIFGDSYEYTKGFINFRKELMNINGTQYKQMSIEDME